MQHEKKNKREDFKKSVSQYLSYFLTPQITNTLLSATTTKKYYQYNFVVIKLSIT